MKKFFMVTLVVCCIAPGVYSQVGIPTNNPNKNAVLDLNRTNGTNDKGLLLPNVVLTSTTSASPMQAHVAGMLVYNTATAGTYPNNVIPGTYYNDGKKWNYQSSGGQSTESAYSTSKGNVYTYNGSNVGGSLAEDTDLTVTPNYWREHVGMRNKINIDATSDVVWYSYCIGWSLACTPGTAGDRTMAVGVFIDDKLKAITNHRFDNITKGNFNIATSGTVTGLTAGEHTVRVALLPRVAQTGDVWYIASDATPAGLLPEFVNRGSFYIRVIK